MHHWKGVTGEAVKYPSWKILQNWLEGVSKKLERKRWPSLWKS